jgi:flavin reductase
MIDAALFKSGMRRLASGVSLVTTVLDGQRHGLVATSVCSVSAEPPSLLVCVNCSSKSHDPIRDAGVFCINVLGAEDDAIARRFGAPEHRDARFADREWASLATGAPALVGALATFDCRISRTVSADTHTIFIASVVAAELGHAGRGALIYLDGRYGTLAPGNVADNSVYGLLGRLVARSAPRRRGAGSMPRRPKVLAVSQVCARLRRRCAQPINTTVSTMVRVETAAMVGSI